MPPAATSSIAWIPSSPANRGKRSTSSWRNTSSRMVKDSPSMERAQARSMVITEGGVAATSQTLASQAGAQTLARGGSAVDAAIVANAVLSVVEPMMCGLGGDLFAIHRSASGELTGINASGGAPAALTLDRVNFSMPNAGIHSVTVPGAVDGWWKLHSKFGRVR